MVSASRWLSALPLATLAVTRWVQDRYKFNRSTTLRFWSDVTRTQCLVLAGIAPLWVLAAFSLGLQTATSHGGAALSAFAQHLLWELSTIFLLNDALVVSRQQAIGVCIGVVNAYTWLAYDLLNFGPRGCWDGRRIRAEEIAVLAPLTFMALTGWLRSRYLYNRGLQRVTRVQWLALVLVRPFSMWAKFAIGLQISRGDEGAAALSMVADAILHYYANVLVLNDSPYLSTQQAWGIVASVGMAAQWLLFDVLMYGSHEQGDVHHVVNGSCAHD